MYQVLYPVSMSEASDAMKMASKEGISLKEAWVKVKAARTPDADEMTVKPAAWDSRREAW